MSILGWSVYERTARIGGEERKRERREEERFSSFIVGAPAEKKKKKKTSERERKRKRAIYPSPSPSPRTMASMFRGLFSGHKLVSLSPPLTLLGHLVIVASSLVYLVPVLGYNLSYLSYKVCLQAVVLTSLLKLVAKHGAPPLRPFSLDKLQRWFIPVQINTDFHYLFLAMSVVSHPPITIALAPHVCLASYWLAVKIANSSVAKTMVWTKLGGAKVYDAMRRHQREALIFNASCEVALAFQCILRLFTRMRSIMLVFMCFNMLKMRYNSPDSKAYHVYVWQQIDGRVVQPYLLRYVPQLSYPIEMAKKYFAAGVVETRTE